MYKFRKYQWHEKGINFVFASIFWWYQSYSLDHIAIQGNKIKKKCEYAWVYFALHGTSGLFSVIFNNAVS